MAAGVFGASSAEISQNAAASRTALAFRDTCERGRERERGGGNGVVRTAAALGTPSIDANGKQVDICCSALQCVARERQRGGRNGVVRTAATLVHTAVLGTPSVDANGKQVAMCCCVLLCVAVCCCVLLCVECVALSHIQPWKRLVLRLVGSLNL